VRKNKSRGTSDNVWSEVQNRGSYHWSRLVDGGPDYSTMGDRANRAFVTGELGIVGVNVHSLRETGHGNQENSEQS
jgi:hypothetical protein